MAEKQWLTASEVTEKIGIPVETVRRYIRTHGVHLKVKKVHKRYVIHHESLTVFKQIRELYADGKNAEEIEQTLSARGVTMTVTVHNEDDEPMTVSVAEELQRMNERLEENERLTKMLLEKLDSQETYIKESMEKRDALLVESLRAIQEEKAALLETAASNEKKEEKKPSFFSKLFGKN